MICRSRRPGLIALALLATLAFGVTPAIAGPPLLCHPYDIGNAPSLPWDGRASWSDIADDYDLSRLVADTMKLLTPAAPIEVRMETLRRAAIYAGTDVRRAEDLIAALGERAREAERRGAADALAYHDVAYAIEALRQMAHVGRIGRSEIDTRGLTALVENLDGRALVQKAVALRPADSDLARAARLIGEGKR